MSLNQLAPIPVTDFEAIHNHIHNFKSEYRNMHLREARYVKGKRSLRYLHAMVALPNSEIEGRISGPDISCHYKMKKVGNKVQVSVLSEKGTPKEKERLSKRFFLEIRNRVQFEQEHAGSPNYPKRSKGQFYLKRGNPGSVINSRSCQQALAAGVLHEAFLLQLSSWKFQLIEG